MTDADLGSRTAEVATCDRTDPPGENRDRLLAETNERVIAEFDRLGGNLSDAFAMELRAQIAASTSFRSSSARQSPAPAFELLADRGVAPSGPRNEGTRSVAGSSRSRAGRPGKSWSMRDSSLAARDAAAW